MAGEGLQRRLRLPRNPPGRWWFAARAAVCLATPVAIGSALGNTGAGLTATIGGFTALYGSDRPYVSRAAHLAVVAMGFAAAVALGDWAARVPWLGILVVCVIAMAATLLCNALAVGPPGAYMFVLACAAGTHAAAEHVTPWRVGTLVLAGGMLAWVAHMAGAVRGLRRPERAAVAAAAAAVVRYFDTIGTPDESAARHAAAQALHRAWVQLVTYQPAAISAGAELRRLRAATRELHLLFAEGMSAVAAGEPAQQQWSTRARELAEPHASPADPEEVPLGRPPARLLVRRALQPATGQLRVVARVGVAGVVAGGIASLLGAQRSYWAMAAAVLVLHQGWDRRRTIRRGIERSIGTWLGLVLAFALLALHPQGLGLAAILAPLQFAIEMLVIPLYAVATVFITPAALLIASGGRPIEDLPGFVLERGFDTLIGAAVAVVVYLATARGRDVAKLSQSIAATLDAVVAVAPHLAGGDVTSPAALTARRDLQLRAFELQPGYQAALAGSPRRRDDAERMWPALVAAEDLSYRTLAMCWLGERHARAGEVIRWPDGELGRFEAVATALARAVRTGTRPAGLEPLPQHGSRELAALRDSLAVRG